MSAGAPVPTGRVARAPGKLVLSGSYSVLWGAPAIVTAASRFAIAEAGRPPVHVAEEVLAAVELGMLDAPCYVDASALRTDDGEGKTRKLGLGSSAAILVATLVARRGTPESAAARGTLFTDALAAHRKAQGGGSGLDVAASTFGGTRTFEIPRAPEGLAGSEPSTSAFDLPNGVSITIFAARSSAVTASFVSRVRALAASDAARFDPLMAAAKAGASEAVCARSVAALVAALGAQRDALARIGEAAGVPIVTPEVARLAASAVEAGAFFGPSGAGGGDVAFHASAEPPSRAFIESAESLGYDLLRCDVGAEGAREVEP